MTVIVRLATGISETALGELSRDHGIDWPHFDMDGEFTSTAIEKLMDKVTHTKSASFCTF